VSPDISVKWRNSQLQLTNPSKRRLYHVNMSHSCKYGIVNFSWLFHHSDVFTWMRHVYMIQMYWHGRDIFTRKRRICTQKRRIRTPKRWIRTQKRPIHTYKRHLRIREKAYRILIMTRTIVQKRRINTQKRPVWIRHFGHIRIETRRIAYTGNCSHDSARKQRTKETCSHTKETYSHTKETYSHLKETYLHVQETCSI